MDFLPEKMKYHSQAGQDRFVHELLGDSGTFLDIGCAHPVDRSNSYFLEKLGWTGWLVDISNAHEAEIKRTRTSPFICGDATRLDWSFLPDKIDYLSLDVDESTHCVLYSLPVAGRFKVVTVEHDAYRFGGSPRQVIRKTFLENGYHLICSDVKDQGLPFEDWWVSAELLEKAKKYESSGDDWEVILERPALKAIFGED